MSGLSRDVVEHRLPIKPGFRPYKQPHRNFNPDIYDQVKEEVNRLLDAKFIRPCRYADWISNIVPIEKKGTKKLRVCIDFRDLNKATPKDEYPMHISDFLVNAAFRHRNAVYNQIFMANEDISKTASICPGFVGLFEWVVMNFGLKNAGPTYQRAMNLIFHDLLGIIVEVYIDDIVVKLAGDDSNFQVHSEFCINPRSVTLSILHHWKRLEVYFPTQLADIDLEFCSKRYSCFSEDCSGCPVPPVRTDRVQTPWSELDEAVFVPETTYLVRGFCERPPTQLGGMFLV
jgi:hypothetical protein